MRMLTNEKKQGSYLVLGALLIGLIYYFFPTTITAGNHLFPLGALFNVGLMGIVLLVTLRTEFIDWFQHFSFKWTLIGIPVILIVGIALGILWTTFGGKISTNSLDSALNSTFIITRVPFMLMGEELLSLGLLYGLWKKWHWSFWQATIVVSVLFAAWHLSTYNYNFLQCLVILTPSRLILNQLFKKTDSVWVPFIVHLTFDVITMLL